MRFFDDTDFTDFKGLPRMHFKGQTQTTKRDIPAQDAVEKGLQGNSVNYANSTMGTANNLLNNTNQVVGNFDNVYGDYNNTSQTVNDGYDSLLKGLLPQQYQANRQQALNADLTGTMGNAINGLGSRGILNSSVTGSALNGITRNASDTLARNFASDMSGYAGILGNTAANNNNNLNNYTGLVSSQLGNANNAYNNTGDLFKTMYSGRMGTAGQTTTENDGGAGLISAIGAIGSAGALCFIGGTKVSTPNGDKNIEDIKLGDLVVSSDGVQTVTYVQEPCISNDKYMTVTIGNKQVTTTSMQTFITPDGDVLAKDLRHVPAKVETVYDFSTTGSNTYYANGLLVRGR